VRVPVRAQALEAEALRAQLEGLQRDLAAAEGICKEGAVAADALGTEVRLQRGVRPLLVGTHSV